MSLRSSRRLVSLRHTLRLPASTQDGISWLDALFVSVSAVSATGLSTVDFPATFTTFGGVVVMVLVQVGGLGIMTLATLGALIVGNRVGFGASCPYARS